MTQAFITAAGRGSRLQSITAHQQKSCLPIQEGVSLLEYHIRRLMVAGIKHFVVNTDYRQDEVVAQCSEISARLGVAIVCSKEYRGNIVSQVNCQGRCEDVTFQGQGSGVSSYQQLRPTGALHPASMSEVRQLGAAGALYLALATGLLQEKFIFMYGDLVHFSSYKPLLDAHAEDSITCTCTFGDLQRGDVVVRRGDKVEAWHPRPHNFQQSGDLDTGTALNPASCYLNAGIYVISRSVLERVLKMQKFPTCEFYMPKYNFSLDQQLIPYLLAIGMSLKSVFIPAVCDIGTPDSYNDALQRVRVRFNKKALFLDRDGILLKPIPRKQYVVSVDHLMPEIKMKRVIAAAVVRDYVPIGVSNQPHVAKGLMWHAEAEAMRSMVQEIFDLPFSSFCPHIEEDECMCRKPRPSMLLRWETELGLDLRNSLLLGDSLVDAQAAVRVGVRPIILRHPYNGDEMEDMPRGTIFIDKVEDAVEYLI